MAAQNRTFWQRNRGLAMFGVTAYLLAGPAFGHFTGARTTTGHQAEPAQEQAAADEQGTNPFPTLALLPTDGREGEGEGEPVGATPTDAAPVAEDEAAPVVALVVDDGGAEGGDEPVTPVAEPEERVLPTPPAPSPEEVAVVVPTLVGDREEESESPAVAPPAEDVVPAERREAPDLAPVAEAAVAVLGGDGDEGDGTPADEQDACPEDEGVAVDGIVVGDADGATSGSDGGDTSREQDPCGTSSQDEAAGPGEADGATLLG